MMRLILLLFCIISNVCASAFDNCAVMGRVTIDVRIYDDQPTPQERWRCSQNVAEDVGALASIGGRSVESVTIVDATSSCTFVQSSSAPPATTTTASGGTATTETNPFTSAVPNTQNTSPNPSSTVSFGSNSTMASIGADEDNTQGILIGVGGGVGCLVLVCIAVIIVLVSRRRARGGRRRRSSHVSGGSRQMSGIHRSNRSSQRLSGMHGSRRNVMMQPMAAGASMMQPTRPPTEGMYAQAPGGIYAAAPSALSVRGQGNMSNGSGHTDTSSETYGQLSLVGTGIDEQSSATSVYVPARAANGTFYSAGPQVSMTLICLALLCFTIDAQTGPYTTIRLVFKDTHLCFFDANLALDDIVSELATSSQASFYTGKGAALRARLEVLDLPRRTPMSDCSAACVEVTPLSGFGRYGLSYPDEFLVWGNFCMGRRVDGSLYGIGLPATGLALPEVVPMFDMPAELPKPSVPSFMTTKSNGVGGIGMLEFTTSGRVTLHTTANANWAPLYQIDLDVFDPACYIDLTGSLVSPWTNYRPDVSVGYRLTPYWVKLRGIVAVTGTDATIMVLPAEARPVRDLRIGAYSSLVDGTTVVRTFATLLISASSGVVSIIGQQSATAQRVTIFDNIRMPRALPIGAKYAGDAGPLDEREPVWTPLILTGENITTTSDPTGNLPISCFRDLDRVYLAGSAALPNPFYVNTAIIRLAVLPPECPPPVANAIFAASGYGNSASFAIRFDVNLNGDVIIVDETYAATTFAGGDTKLSIDGFSYFLA